jgi:hypothetical protein
LSPWTATLRVLALWGAWCLLASPQARADDDTYCVGGYSGRPPFATARCGSRAIARMHPHWHFHMWVRRGNDCFACYDEVDNSCESHFLRDYTRFRAVRDPVQECPQADTTDVVVVHKIHGVDVTPKPPPPPPPPAPPPSIPDPATPSRPTRPAPGDAGNPPPPRPGDAGNSAPPRPGDAGNPAPTRPAPNDASAPPAPPDPPVALTVQLDRIPPGPHEAGDTVPLSASVRDPSGDIRGVPGGTFVVTVNGDEVRIPAVVQPDGTLKADLRLPQADSVAVRFEVDPPKLASNEHLTSTRTDPTTLRIESCPLRARIVEPVQGAGVAVGEPITLAAEVFDASGAPASSAGLVLSFHLSPSTGASADVSAGADGRAVWSPEAALDGQSVRISASGIAGGRNVCPAGEVSLPITSFGIGLDPQELPSQCYASMACGGTARLVRPASALARQKVDALLADPATRVQIYDGAELIAELPPAADDRYRIDRRYEQVRQADWRVLISATSVSIELPTHVVDVRAPLDLKLPESLDFGAVVAGTALTDACVTLDFAASTAYLDHALEVTVVGLEDCNAEPVLAFRNAFGLADSVPLTSPATVHKLDPSRPMLDLCLRTSGCVAEHAPDGVKLVVRPTTPEFKDQVREVRLTWEVLGRGFFACHGWWMIPLIAGTLIAGLVWGFVRPYRFKPHTAIRVAGNLQALRRSSAQTLVDLPGSGAGWYRNARLALHGDGSLDGRMFGALVTLRATRHGVVLIAPGLLEQHDRRSGTFKPVDDARAGHTPTSQGIYKAGDVIFQLEGA